MKYYVSDYNDDDTELIAFEKRYVEYIASVWNSLPADLRLLCDRRSPFSPKKVYLNDSNVQSIHADFDRKSVDIVMLGEALNQQAHQIGQRQFTLSYTQLQHLTS